MEYFAKIVKDEDCFLVSFDDFPNIMTFGETLEEAFVNASEALNGSLESDFERGFELPKRSKLTGSEYYAIPVLPHIEISYELREMRDDRSQIDIARQLGVSYQAYQKLENPRKCNPTIKTLEKISSVLGKKLEVTFS